MDVANFADTFGRARIIECPAIDTCRDIFFRRGVIASVYAAAGGSGVVGWEREVI